MPVESESPIMASFIPYIWEWTREDWTLVVAVAALILPVLVALFKRFFRAGAVDIYETGMLEIGYSGFGATIGVLGTLRSRDRDMFIQNAYLTLIPPAGGSPQRFDWATFRTAKTILGQTGTITGQVGQTGEVSFDVPASFLISAIQPHRYNIVFVNTTLLQQLRPTFQSLVQAWLPFAQAVIGDTPSALNSQAQQKLQQSFKRAYDKFADGPEYGEALGVIDRLFFWVPGTYRLTLHVNTARPSRHYSKTWSFTLQEAEVNNLRLNSSAILDELCGLPLSIGQYQFAYVSYV